MMLSCMSCIHTTELSVQSCRHAIDQPYGVPDVNAEYSVRETTKESPTGSDTNERYILFLGTDYTGQSYDR